MLAINCKVLDNNSFLFRSQWSSSARSVKGYFMVGTGGMLEGQTLFNDFYPIKNDTHKSSCLWIVMFYLP